MAKRASSEVPSNIPLILEDKQQQGIVAFYKEAQVHCTSQWNLRERMRQIDLQYMREVDFSNEQHRASLSNRLGDTTKFQNIVVPVVMPAVESAVAYQSSVFLTGNPLFGVLGGPKYVNQALAMQSIIDDQAVRGGWAQELMMAFRDAFKYNLAACEVSWCEERTPAIGSTETGNAKVDTTVIWRGNKLKRRDPYNLIFDARVPLTEIPSRGEFAGFVERMSRIELKRYINGLDTKMNVTDAYQSGLGTNPSGGSAVTDSYYLPQVNPEAMLDEFSVNGTTNWLSWVNVTEAKRRIDYKDTYEVSTLYARILPSDFRLNVPHENHPQIWKFVIVNHQVLVHAKRLTNAHDYLPMLFMQPHKDGLEFQTKSLAKNVQPIQQLQTAMMSSVIAARRRAISDRMLYNPLNVSPSAINSDNPMAKIPVLPAGYNKPLSESVYQFPFRDDQSQFILQYMPYFSAMADKITGQNPARQGQFVKGNKTLSEYNDVMTNAEGRDQMASILLEHQFFTPLKELLKINILQYQSTGEVYSRSEDVTVTIDPVELRNAVLQFKMADGVLPMDKLLNADSWQVAMNTISTSPAIGSAYNIGPMFSYLMKTRGADVGDFEKSQQQLQYESAVQAWMQAAQLAAQKGAPFSAPQPLPQQFGYDPAMASPSAAPSQ